MATSADPTMSRFPSGMVSPRPMRSRTQSLSSDRPSTIGAHSLMSPPLSVSPEAAFIAASAASQIVTNDHDSHADTWYDQHGIEPAGETALVSQSALKLVNSFLDQLLFGILQVSRATTLSALRPAVIEVLKPKLAKDAINNADEELQEYLGGADEDDYVQPQGANPSRDWDLELVWKRTRLRCMVYSSLGDMEEEDEDLFMEQENLEIGADEQISDVISPAVAIFLTSVMEYMGELTLTVAGQAAYHRMRTKFEKDITQGSRDAEDIADRIVVEELDMERVALDRTLGRLWRGWKKRIRTPAIDLSGRPYSRNSSGHLRQESNVTDVQTPKPVNEEGSEAEKSEAAAEGTTEEGTIAEDVQPFDIPLPLGDKDIDEIEVPGLASMYSDDEDEEEDEEIEELKTLRPKSLLINPSLIANGLPTPTLSQPQSPTIATRKRSNSLPLPGTSSFYPQLKRSRIISDDAASSNYDDNDKDDSATESSFQDAVENNGREADVTADFTQDPADEVEKQAPEESATNKRISMLVSGAAAAGAAAVAGVTALATGKGLHTESEDVADDNSKYEKAKIMTSSRISVARSSSPSISEYSRPELHQRSSSVHSARLIDVSGPKSPSGSRSPSQDTTERTRPVSLSRTSSVSAPSIADEPRNPRVAEAAIGTGVAVSTSRIPADRMRPALQSANTISESEEEADSVPALKKKTEPINFSKPSPSSPMSDDGSGRVRSSYIGYAPGNKQPSPTKQDHFAPSTKVTILGKTNAAGQFIEEKVPDLPRKASARHATRGDGMSSLSLERTRTRESDEEPALPSQSNNAARPIHTSGSSASSGTGRIKPVRTSEEHMPNHAENVARNFEELIHSNQTITYTLTPENMRDIDSSSPIVTKFPPSSPIANKFSPSSPIVSKFPRKSEDVRAQPRSRSSSTATEIKAVTTGHRPTPLSSHPVSESVAPAMQSPRAPSIMSQKSNRLSSAMARDARVPGESTADFAEFIKSTGPPGDNRPAPLRNVNGGNGSAKNSLDSRRVSTTSNRNRYQPREAAVDIKADNSDLIDFIRQGPPSTMNNHRIPRHVAPFRNTMDSEQMSGGTGGRAVDATIPEIRYSQASTSVTDNSMPSMQSSINSNSALIKNKPTTMPSSKMFDDDDMMPKRKTRRVKDPYAIDFSDEDDDGEFITTPVAPTKKEESLAEFLRNYDPPPEPMARPPPQKQPKKKASAPSLMGRLTRNYGRDSNNTPSAPSIANIDSRSLNSRTGTSGTSGSRGYVPIQVNMPAGYDKYGALDNGVSRARMPSNAGSMGRVPMKKFEPREAVSGNTETADLAAFLRDSGPPGGGAPPVRPVAQHDEPNGLSKMFGRRKKAFA